MKTRIMHHARLGLVEMTHRRKPLAILQTTCPCQQPRRSLGETVAAAMGGIGGSAGETRIFHVLAVPQVIMEFIGPFGEYVDEMEQELDCSCARGRMVDEPRALDLLKDSRRSCAGWPPDRPSWRCSLRHSARAGDRLSAAWTV